MRVTTIKYRQRGAVAILIGFVLVILIAFAGLVIDLGRLYVAKTELQNAADAAALAGAKLLDGTAAGVGRAVHGSNSANPHDGAIYTAGLHRYDFTSKPVTITIANISIGDCPEDACMVAASNITSDSVAAGKTFLKVDTAATGAQTFDTFLMQVLRVFVPDTEGSTQTFGLAVAGRQAINVAPIGVCAISIPNPGNLSVVTSKAPVTGELLELGFRRGIAYNIFDLNRPLGSGPAGSDKVWINPIDSGATCSPSNSNSPNTVAFLCTGHSVFNLTTFPALLYRNTGISAGPAERALNSRFDQYAANTCDPATAPPDRNIKRYDCSGSGDGCVASGSGLPRDWMDPAPGSNIPSQQSISIDAVTAKPIPAPSFVQYGALWSFSPAVRATADVPPKAGTAFTLNDWNAANGSTINLYGGPADQAQYPSPSPYAQTLGSNFFQTPSHAGAAERRVMRIAIVNCSAPLGTTACSPLQVLAVGKFLLRTRADLTGGNQFVAEFGGLVTPITSADIKLYR